ncbi:MAG: uridine diphosphate-N-acetylglucosamine-binding protein YvcK, partial [Candidatus Woesearchaeota archaeon]
RFMLNVVCIGGGTGQSEILRGLKNYDCNITAIVAVTDSGRSTGVIRNNFNTIAPGDIRNCIVALSESEHLIKDLFHYRFDKGVELEGMSFGNLFLTAMSKVKGDMFSAIKETSKILKIKGKVLPSTLFNTHICAELENNEIVEQELNVRKPNKSRIKRIFLKDQNVKSPKEVINAINKSDLIIIGPGSLYTSILVHFLIPNLKKAFLKSKAKKIFLCNMVTQSGQTDNYTIKDHIDEALKYCEKLDYVIINNKKPHKRLMKEYEKEGGYLLKINGLNNLKKTKIIFEDLLKEENKKIIEWNKVSSIRHDPNKTTKCIMKLNEKKKIKAVILAAGNSTRLRPFSFSESKTMIKFLGKPLLQFHVEECIKNDINDIAIVCNKENIKQIKKHFKKYKKIKYYIQEKQIGTADALISAKEFIKDSYFILKFGDSIASKDEIPKLIDIFKKEKSEMVVALKKVKNTSEFGIAKFNKDKIVKIIEKPLKNPPSNFALVGFGILNGDLFIEAFNKFKYEKQTAPQQYLLELGVESPYFISEAKRLDVGRAWNLIEANKMLIERYGNDNKNIDIPKNAKISNTSYICPDAIISDNVIIEGYSSISGLIGEGTKITDSFIMEGSRVGKNCKIDASVIGKNNNIGNNFVTKINGKEIKIYVKGRYINPTIKKAGIYTGKNVTIMDNLYSMPGKMVYPNKIIRKNIKQDKLIRAILFDADNTLYNTKKVAKKADMEAIDFLIKEIKKLNSKNNNKFDIKKLNKEKLYNDWKEIINKLKNSKNPEKRTRKYSYKKLLMKYILSLNEKNYKTIHEKMYKKFVKKLVEEISLMENLNKVFELKSKYKFAVFSEDSFDLTLAKLRKLKIETYFDLIITSDEIGKMK